MTLTSPQVAPLPVADRLGLDKLTRIPNLVTVVRTLASVVVGAIGVAQGDVWLLAVAYAVYWAGDIADGWLARRLELESRFGAVLDIVCDRLCTGLLCVGLLSVHPGVLAVAIVFLLNFMAMDTMLSLAFLCWPIDTPNDFHVVDQAVYRVNWSPVGKAVNTAGVVGAVAIGVYPVALAVAVAVGVVKIWSAHRVIGLLRAAQASPVGP